MAESTAPRPQLQMPIPIAQMGPGFFWARPASIGLSPEEADAIRNGTADEAQQERALHLFQQAMTALYEAPGNSSFRRPF